LQGVAAEEEEEEEEEVEGFEFEEIRALWVTLLKIVL